MNTIILALSITAIHAGVTMGGSPAVAFEMKPPGLPVGRAGNAIGSNGPANLPLKRPVTPTLLTPPAATIRWEKQ